MRVLVTGGAGYVGSTTVRILAQRGHSVLVLDDLSTGSRQAVGDATLVVGSISDRALVGQLLHDERIEGVLHLAGRKSPAESLVAPERYFRENVGGSLELLSAMSEAAVPILVFSSSCAVYGYPDSLPVRESATLAPTTPYGESKLLVERMLPWFGERYGLRYAALRYFNATGALMDGSLGEDWDQAINLLPVVMKAAFGRIPAVEIFGTDYPTRDGTAVRDYVHVIDLAEAHADALEHLERHDGRLVLNLGTGTGSTVAEVIEVAEKVLGRSIPFRHGPRRAGDPPAIWADPSLAEQVLGWRARHDLSDIVESAARWHSANPRGFTASSTT
jgi:UDP-glucose-4-epimerase GalE